MQEISCCRKRHGLCFARNYQPYDPIYVFFQTTIFGALCEYLWFRVTPNRSRDTGGFSLNKWSELASSYKGLASVVTAQQPTARRIRDWAQKMESAIGMDNIQLAELHELLVSSTLFLKPIRKSVLAHLVYTRALMPYCNFKWTYKHDNTEFVTGFHFVEEFQPDTVSWSRMHYQPVVKSLHLFVRDSVEKQVDRWDIRAQRLVQMGLSEYHDENPVPDMALDCDDLHPDWADHVPLRFEPLSKSRDWQSMNMSLEALGADCEAYCCYKPLVNGAMLRKYTPARDNRPVILFGRLLQVAQAH